MFTKKISLVITPTISFMQDQTHELNKVGIKTTYLGSAQFAPHAESEVFSQDSDTLIVFVSPDGKDDRNLMRVQSLYKEGRLGLIAAHLMYDWQDFRQSYRRCEELHALFFLNSIDVTFGNCNT